MARKDRKDRGLYSTTNAAGTTVWKVRVQHEGRERHFGPFPLNPPPNFILASIPSLLSRKQSGGASLALPRSLSTVVS